ncbi:MAG: HEAT repeat domain-containing protein [Methanomicrobiales archaeon]|nr:HEAT repeat domain-containing protein [Methanomicrobiales archaeon]
MTGSAGSYIQALKRDNLQGRREAENALVSFGEKAVGPLIDSLKSEKDPDVRWYIARALARIGDPSIDPLLDLLRESVDPKVRGYAAAALAGVGEPAIEPLIRVLVGPDRAMRGEAARALCGMGPRTIPYLKKAMEHAAPAERRILEMTLMRVDERGIQTAMELQGVDPSESSFDRCRRIDE